MADKYLNSKIQLRNDTEANWISENPVLLKGEIAVTIDKNKFKFGDGVKTWNQLKYASAETAVLKTVSPTFVDTDFDIGILWINTTSEKAFILVNINAGNAVWQPIVSPDDLETLGSGDMLISKYATNAKSSSGYVDKAIIADKLAEAVDVSITGDVAGSASFDGSDDVTINAVLSNIISAGSGAKVTVNAKGLVTAIEPLVASDIPDLTMSKITDAGTAATKDTGLSVGNVVVVGSDGKIDDSLMPSLAIVDVFDVADETEMLTLNAQPGDVAMRSDISKVFILKQAPASVLANWWEWKTPVDAVLSVNGETGVINLTTAKISEDTNLYYTEARATANFESNFSTKSSSELTDGSTILHSTDVLILNGGTSSGW